MKINPSIFRLYDVRGLVPDDLSSEVAFLIGAKFIDFLRQNGFNPLKIAIGRDCRLSSKDLFNSLAKGIIKRGCDVVDLGLVTTPMVYFASSQLDFDGGIMITASHNPNPYNGLKITRKGAISLGGETGLFWIRDRIQDLVILKTKNGKIKQENIEKDYLDFVLNLSRIKKNDFKNFSIAIDCGNGSAGTITQKILKTIGTKIYPLYCDPNGNFPNHVPDPTIKENLKNIKELIKNKKPDFGLAIDGDGDRFIFIDDEGEMISGDLIIALMAKIILRNNPGVKILFNVSSSRIVGETIKKYGGQPIEFKLGHALIKEKMRKEGIYFGGETSGHYYLGQDLFFEIPYFVLIQILKEMEETKQKLSEIIKPFRKYYHSGEINFKITNTNEIIKKLKEKYSNGALLEIDGVKINYQNWWFGVRPSNTEPLLRLVVEADSVNLLEEKKKEIIEIITQK